jgi:hypothetical protein
MVITFASKLLRYRQTDPLARAGDSGRASSQSQFHCFSTPLSRLQQAPRYRCSPKTFVGDDDQPSLSCQMRTHAENLFVLTKEIGHVTVSKGPV